MKKYTKDKEGRSILGEQYGITITRPWNNKMYEHNEKVLVKMIKEVRAAIKANKTNVAALNDIARSVTAYTFASHDSKEITKSLLEELPNVQAFWMHQEYPMLVEQGYCKALSKGMVGYDKL
jgi:hypothetical protein